jgi:hypothetical protein
LAPHQESALDRLTLVQAMKGFYLAGGTAIALHLGHRQSVDLDFFSLAPSVDLDRTRQAIVQVIPDAQVLALSDATLRLMVEGTPVDIVRYPYPPLEEPAAGIVPFRSRPSSTSLS